jgi:hypothetical protein
MVQQEVQVIAIEASHNGEHEFERLWTPVMVVIGVSS